MANTKLKNVSDIISMEQQGSQFGSAAALSGSFTVPGNTGRITVYCSGAVHWTPAGTATTSFAHAVAANEPFTLEANQHGASIISDSGSVTATVAYHRGSQRQDNNQTYSRPY